jgi:signal transduction histidine kinase
MELEERPAWYSSFYWRIAISFVLFIVVVLVGQSVMVSYMASRSNNPFSSGNPNAEAAAIASSVGRALATSPDVSVESHLRRSFPTMRPSAFVLMKDGRLARFSDNATVPEDLQRQTAAMLSGAAPEQSTSHAPPVVTAPILLGNELKGMVVLPPPPGSAGRGVFRDVGRLLSLPGTLVLIVVTIIAAVVIFAPARQRLRGLEQAAELFGAGHLEARAPETGSDEIARVATAFNRMAAELATRNETLHSVERQRRQMLADVSHELRTPLTTMRGYLDTLEMPSVSLDEDTKSRYLDTVRHETGRLERIVVDLLDLARHENGGSSLDIRVFAVDRVFGHVARRYEREAQRAGITIRMHIADAADQVVGDPDRIEQAIDNLVANAMRHTPRGGTIELGAAITTLSYRLSVTDSGDGIPPENLRNVFDRFYKVDESRMAGIGGSGLGLSIVKAIAQRHKGAVSVTSWPGFTEFMITLPRRDVVIAMEPETQHAVSA